MAENVPNLMKHINLQMKEAQQISINTQDILTQKYHSQTAKKTIRKP